MKRFTFLLILIVISVSAVSAVARLNDFDLTGWRTTEAPQDAESVTVEATPAFILSPVTATPCPIFTGKDCMKDMRPSIPE